MSKVSKSCSVEEQLCNLNRQIAEAVAHWKDIKENGCHDPFWPDGVNMNLVRNHIIYYLNQIADLDTQPMQLSMFNMGYDGKAHVNVMEDSRIPPKVSDDYMARERPCNYFNGR